MTPMNYRPLEAMKLVILATIIAILIVAAFALLVWLVSR